MILWCLKKIETGQLELTVAHKDYCDGSEVAVVLSPDYCSYELYWMHMKRRVAWKQNNNVAVS